MDYAFRKNGDISLTLKPDHSAIELAFFKEIFDGEVTFTKVSSANHADEIVIKRKPVNFIPDVIVVRNGAVI